MLPANGGPDHHGLGGPRTIDPLPGGSSQVRLPFSVVRRRGHSPHFRRHRLRWVSAGPVVYVRRGAHAWSARHQAL
eukprot:13932413-Alexandrium_andersonii.AAC.1